MISQSMSASLEGASQIRAWFAEGARRKLTYGENAVFDFTLGNPSLAPPQELNVAIGEILEQEPVLALHGYNQSAAGFSDVRQILAEDLNLRFGTNYAGEHLVMTAGAAMGLNILLKVLLDPGDRVAVLVPYFGEYRHYIRNHGGEMDVIPCGEDFLPDLEALESALGPDTRALIINTPNNPSGVIYPPELLERISSLLAVAGARYGRPVALISDEPYRELFYGDRPPFVADFYPHTAVVYSYSKSLSLAGERIGYVLVPPAFAEAERVLEALAIANRILGCVNAPNLQQKLVARLTRACGGRGFWPDMSFYAGNRDLLYTSLVRLGFRACLPQGAFYLLLAAPDGDGQGLCRRASEHNLLMVPGASFGLPAYARLAFCCPREVIEGSLAAFGRLAAEYGLSSKDI